MELIDQYSSEMLEDWKAIVDLVMDRMSVDEPEDLQELAMLLEKLAHVLQHSVRAEALTDEVGRLLKGERSQSPHDLLSKLLGKGD